MATEFTTSTSTSTTAIIVVALQDATVISMYACLLEKRSVSFVALLSYNGMLLHGAPQWFLGRKEAKERRTAINITSITNIITSIISTTEITIVIITIAGKTSTSNQKSRIMILTSFSTIT